MLFKMSMCMVSLLKKVIMISEIMLSFWMMMRVYLSRKRRFIRRLLIGMVMLGCWMSWSLRDLMICLRIRRRMMKRSMMMRRRGMSMMIMRRFWWLS